MGTRSIIAIPQDGGFKGRYAHWDGYPTHMAKELHAIVARDGIEVARRTLTEDHYGWSVIYADRDPDNSLDHGVKVPGYGVAYTDSEPDEWLTHKDTDSWCEWAYVLNDTGLAVLEYTDHRFVHVGNLAYDAAATEAELARLECGAEFERCSHYAWYHVPELDAGTDHRGMAEYLAGLNR